MTYKELDHENNVAFIEKLFEPFGNLSIKDLETMTGVTGIDGLNISFETSQAAGAGVTVRIIRPVDKDEIERNEVVELQAAYNSENNSRTVSVTFQNQRRFFRLDYTPTSKENQDILHLKSIQVASLPEEDSFLDGYPNNSEKARKTQYNTDFDLGVYRLNILVPPNFDLDPDYLTLVHTGMKYKKRIKHPFSFSDRDGDHVTFSANNDGKFCKSPFDIILPTYVVLNPYKLMGAVPKLNRFKVKG